MNTLVFHKIKSVPEGCINVLFLKKNKKNKKKIGGIGNQTALDLLSEVASIARRIGRL
jgi:hypothetical protein